MGTTGWFYFCFCDRITPAYAGKSLFCFTAAVPIQDHPRVCGEKYLQVLPRCFRRGSPPRMRGKVVLGSFLQMALGITPAYAGKRFVLTVQQGWKQDHPRVCGEKPPSCPEMSTNEGSPPRMRGKDVLHCNCLSEFGITPAYAGKSPCLPCKLLTGWDHPRVCGEKHAPARAQGLITGSPPRMRGKGFFHFAHKVFEGITPAYAGKSRPPPENAAGTFCAPHPDASGGCSPVPPDG